MVIIRVLIWLSMCLLLWVVAVGISYQANRLAHFGYPLWYELINIDGHIKRYAPLNKMKRKDFHLTDKSQHLLLFEQLNEAVHQQPEKLGDIQYTTNSGSKPWLTESEIIHLKDVHQLLRDCMVIWWLCLPLAMVLLWLYWQSRLQFPSVQTRRAVAAVILLAGVTGYWMVGFDDLYRLFHESVFPPQHQWYFDYHQSLMTTLLKAPDLFAIWAAQIGGLALIICIAALMAVQRRTKSKVR
ncbi:DUF1461 domain-containing protein [Neiella sp. HB171785]|uniref:DUF1461 domain-containing protein n=1 Tax=Neiella litorisoli TaxID=2771431 RepID=A0A8J6R1N6_9GAMM|nr:DUF1461 domain-containing protein [Neiella litorisoli]MBD1387985.1 DUF1461 domain-containing protein [Neiella litorisoli]